MLVDQQKDFILWFDKSKITSTAIMTLGSWIEDHPSLEEQLLRLFPLCVQVPRVFVNGNCIGGGSDTKRLHQEGKLLPLIEQCAPCCAASGEGSGGGDFPSAK